MSRCSFHALCRRHLGGFALRAAVPRCFALLVSGIQSGPEQILSRPYDGAAADQCVRSVRHSNHRSGRRGESGQARFCNFQPLLLSRLLAAPQPERVGLSHRIIPAMACCGAQNTKQKRRANYGMKPLVSAVVPAYNSAATLARALDSIRAQDYGAIEIIVVDDGS